MNKIIYCFLICFMFACSVESEDVSFSQDAVIDEVSDSLVGTRRALVMEEKFPKMYRLIGQAFADERFI